MIKSDGLQRICFLTAVLCVWLAAAPGAVAQSQEIVYSVSPNEAWPKSTRVDGKLTALSFSFATQWTGTAGAAKLAVQDAVLTIPAGEAVARWWKRSLERKHMQFVLIEFPLVGQKTGPRAPFAVRLSEVLVTSVQLSKQKGDAGPGIAEVKLNAAKFEIFTASQDATGAMKPSFGMTHDFKRNQTF